MKKGIMGELKKVFRPEFLNRIDEVIVFHKLTKEEIRSIVELLLKRIRESLAERELSLNLTDDAADLLVEKGWDPSMGARPLRRAIQRYIEDPLADEVLAQNAAPGSTVEVDRDRDDERRSGEPRSRSPSPPASPWPSAPRAARAASPSSRAATRRPARGRRPDLPDEPEVLPDVPDAPPAPEGEGEPES